MNKMRGSKLIYLYVGRPISNSGDLLGRSACLYIPRVTRGTLRDGITMYPIRSLQAGVSPRLLPTVQPRLSASTHAASSFLRLKLRKLGNSPTRLSIAIGQLRIMEGNGGRSQLMDVPSWWLHSQYKASATASKTHSLS